MPSTRTDARRRWRAAIGDRTRLLWLETISNPTTAMRRHRGRSRNSRTRAASVVVVDNTFASPALATPADAGCRPRGALDDEVHRGPLRPHGRGGGRSADARRPRRGTSSIEAGGNASPWEAFLALRGLKTLALRMERHSSNALAVARALEGAPGVARCSLSGPAVTPAARARGAHPSRRDGRRDAGPRARRRSSRMASDSSTGSGRRPRHQPRQRRDARQPSGQLVAPAARRRPSSPRRA